MNEKLTDGAIKYIIGRVIENADIAKNDLIERPKDDYLQGRKMAYYEILDTIKNELEAHDQDLKEFGLDINLEKEYL